MLDWAFQNQSQGGCRHVVFYLRKFDKLLYRKLLLVKDCVTRKFCGRYVK